jgi:hypothetical protein
VTAQQGWGTWEEDHGYPSPKDDGYEVVVYKRTQRYGDDERVFWKNVRRKLRTAPRRK